MKKTIGELSEETLKLIDFLQGQENGAVLDYLDIQAKTSVFMDAKGKGTVRRALKHLRREYSSVRGFGIKLASSESVIPIISGRIRRIDKAVRRADKSQKLLQEQFFQSLSEVDQQKVLFAGAIFGAIRLAADEGRNIHRKAVNAPIVHIPLPLNFKSDQP
jgi:hypothetical protein